MGRLPGQGRKLRFAVGVAGVCAGLALLVWGVLDGRDAVIVAGATVISLAGILPVSVAVPEVRLGPIALVPREQSPEREALRVTEGRLGGLARLICDDHCDADELAELALSDLLVRRTELNSADFAPYALRRFFALLEAGEPRRGLLALIGSGRPSPARPEPASPSRGEAFRARFPDLGPRERAAVILGILCALPVDEVASLVALSRQRVGQVIVDAKARLPRGSTGGSP